MGANQPKLIRVEGAGQKVLNPPLDKGHFQNSVYARAVFGGALEALSAINRFVRKAGTKQAPKKTAVGDSANHVDEATQFPRVMRRQWRILSAQNTNNQGLHVHGFKGMFKGGKLIQNAACGSAAKISESATMQQPGLQTASRGDAPSDQISDLLL